MGDGQAETYVGISPKAGAGQTITLINISNILGKDAKTLYIDLDILNPGGTTLLGLEKENSLWSILSGNAKSDKFVYTVENFDVMPLYIFKSKDMSSYLDDEEEIIRQMIDVINDMVKNYDYIFIDTLPGYTITSVMVWQKFEHLIGIGNYNLQSVSSLLQVTDIFKEWSARNLIRDFDCIIFNDTGNHEKIEDNVLRELYTGTPIFTVPYTREFYSSSALANNDPIYSSSLKKILKFLDIP